MIRERNIMISKAGGKSSKNTKIYRVSIPVGMIRELGITEDDRAVTLTCENGKIIIEKSQSTKRALEEVKTEK